MAAVQPAALRRMVSVVVVRLAFAAVPAREGDVDRRFSLLAALLVIFSLLAGSLPALGVVVGCDGSCHGEKRILARPSTTV
jgi:hypothetical protein